MFELRGGALCGMKLFAYEHPSGPVHEVEVTLGDTVHGGVRLQPPTPRQRCDGGDEAPQDRRPVARTPRALDRAVSRGFWTEPHRTRPPRRPRNKHAAQVLQLKSKIEQAMWTSARESNFRHPTPSTRRCPRDRVGSRTSVTA